MSSYISLNTAVDNYAVVGNPVRHSKSPAIHHLFAEQLGHKIFYQKLSSSVEDLHETLLAFEHAGGKGVNITLPFKTEVVSYCSILNEAARKVKAVNTISFDPDRGWVGENTDGVGLVCDLENNMGVRLSQKDILILGAGGAVRGVLAPICACSPRRITLVNRTLSRAEALANELDYGVPIFVSSYETLAEQKFQLIINGTSASIKDELPPLPAGILATGGCCYDFMYADQPTPFLKWGTKAGAKVTADGLGMLVEQAAQAFYLWRGVKPETAEIIRRLRNY